MLWASPSTNLSKVLKMRHPFQKTYTCCRMFGTSHTLRFLVFGDSQKSLNFALCFGTTAVSNINKEACIVFKEVLTDKFVKPIRCETDWLEIARGFEEIWYFRNVVGALDEKHIQIEEPAKSGTLFHKYKGFFSIVLLTICDANYCFTLVYTGQSGSKKMIVVF